MKSSNILISLLFIAVWQLSAQELVYKSYNWGESPSIPTDIKNEKVTLKHKEIIEFCLEDNYFFEYQIKHVVEFINSDEQVKLNNKKFVPFGQTSELIEAKIRVVKPDNKTMMLDESKILTSTDENTDEHYKYFALEGLEKGSVIDYYYVVKKNPNYNGKKVYIQDENDVNEFQFELYCPSNLIFAFKVYNDTIKVSNDTLVKDKNHWILTMNNVKGLKEEDSSPYFNLLKQLVYKLDKNIALNKHDISSFGKASENIYRNIFITPDKKDEKALISFLKPLKLSECTNEEERIIKIEDHLKDNINFVTTNQPEYSKIESIIKLKSATEIGMLRLMTRAFETEQIKYQVVLTCNRTNTIFDKDFESFNSLTDYLIYFPGTKKFLAPDLFEFRYGLIPWKFTDNYGLFIKETSIGDFKSGIGKVNYIPPLELESSYQNIDVDAIIENDFSKVNFNFIHTTMGYYGIYIQPYYSNLNEERKKDFINDLFKAYFKEGQLDEYEVINGEAKYVGKKPIIEKLIGSTTELVDVAGNKYIFKVGKFIGRQVELYSEEERRLPVDDRYKRLFVRKIKFNIPEGYVIKNLDDLKFFVEYKIEGNRGLLFESNYKVDGQNVIIDIKEYYDQLKFNLSEYEAYRKVVNSAADFEKVVLIFEKE